MTSVGDLRALCFNRILATIDLRENKKTMKSIRSNKQHVVLNTQKKSKTVEIITETTTALLVEHYRPFICDLCPSVTVLDGVPITSLSCKKQYSPSRTRRIASYANQFEEDYKYATQNQNRNHSKSGALQFPRDDLKPPMHDDITPEKTKRPQGLSVYVLPRVGNRMVKSCEKNTDPPQHDKNLRKFPPSCSPTPSTQTHARSPNHTLTLSTISNASLGVEDTSISNGTAAHSVRNSYSYLELFENKMKNENRNRLRNNRSNIKYGSSSVSTNIDNGSVDSIFHSSCGTPAESSMELNALDEVELYAYNGDGVAPANKNANDAQVSSDTNTPSLYRAFKASNDYNRSGGSNVNSCCVKNSIDGTSNSSKNTPIMKYQPPAIDTPKHHSIGRSASTGRMSAPRTPTSRPCDKLLYRVGSSPNPYKHNANISNKAVTVTSETHSTTKKNVEVKKTVITRISTPCKARGGMGKGSAKGETEILFSAESPCFASNDKREMYASTRTLNDIDGDGNLSKEKHSLSMHTKTLEKVGLSKPVLSAKSAVKHTPRSAQRALQQKEHDSYCDRLVGYPNGTPLITGRSSHVNSEQSLPSKALRNTNSTTLTVEQTRSNPSTLDVRKKETKNNSDLRMQRKPVERYDDDVECLNECDSNPLMDCKALQMYFDYFGKSALTTEHGDAKTVQGDYSLERPTDSSGGTKTLTSTPPKVAISNTHGVNIAVNSTPMTLFELAAVDCEAIIDVDAPSTHAAADFAPVVNTAIPSAPFENMSRKPGRIASDDTSQCELSVSSMHHPALSGAVQFNSAQTSAIPTISNRNKSYSLELQPTHFQYINDKYTTEDPLPPPPPISISNGNSEKITNDVRLSQTANHLETSTNINDCNISNVSMHSDSSCSTLLG